MKSKASRERRQARLYRQKPDVAYKNASYLKATAIQRSGQNTESAIEKAETPPPTASEDGQTALTASTPDNLVLRLSLEEALLESESPGAESAGTSPTNKPADTIDGSCSLPTPAFTTITSDTRSQVQARPLVPIENTPSALGCEAEGLASEVKQISAGEKVFGIVELGEVILGQESMRRLFVLRTVSVGFSDLIARSTLLRRRMFMMHTVKPIGTPAALNPILLGSGDGLALLQGFQVTHDMGEGWAGGVPDRYCINLTFRVRNANDLRDLRSSINHKVSGSWTDTTIFSRPIRVMHFLRLEGRLITGRSLACKFFESTCAECLELPYSERSGFAVHCLTAGMLLRTVQRLCKEILADSRLTT